MADFSELAKYFSTPVKPVGPGVKDVANYILLNSDASKAVGPGAIQVDNSPSVMSRIFDILSRPNYAIANTVRDVGRGTDDPLSSFISGLAGTQKTTFQDVLKDTGMPDSFGRAGLGFLMDVFLDPTTYIPGGQIAKVGKLAKGIFKGGKAAEDLDRTLPAAAKFAQGEKAVAGETPVALTPSLPDIKLPTSVAPGQVPGKLDLFPTQPTLPGMEHFGPEVLPETPPIPKAPGQVKGQFPLDFGPGFKLGDLKRPLPEAGNEFEKLGKQGSTQPSLFGLDTLEQINKGRQAVPELPPPPKSKLSPKTGEIVGQKHFRYPGFSMKDIRKAGEAARVAAGDTAPKILNNIADGSVPDVIKTIPSPKPKITPEIQQLADGALKGFDPSKAKARINKLSPDTLNAKQQVALWHRAAKVASGDLNRTAAVYHAMENSLRGAGYVPRIGTGDNVALSDVVADLIQRGVPVDDSALKEFSSNIIRGSAVHGAVERLRASSVMRDAPIVKEITDAVSEAKTATKTANSMSDAELFDFDKFVKGFGKQVADRAGASPAAISGLGKMLDATLAAGKTPAQVAIEATRRELEDVVARGVASPKANHALTLALEKDLGKLPKWAVNDNKAVEFLAGRFVSWHGQSDLRPMSLVAAASAAGTAAARGKALNHLFQGYNASQRLEAFRGAQGIAALNTPETARLASGIAQTMDNLTGQAMGASVILRSGVNMDLLNKWMSRYNTGFKFTKGDLPNPVDGTIKNFGEGTDWVDSWKYHDLKGEDPASFMFKTMQALEQATREKAMFDEIGERFGSPAYGKSYTNKITGHPYLGKYYFP